MSYKDLSSFDSVGAVVNFSTGLTEASSESDSTDGNVGFPICRPRMMNNDTNTESGGGEIIDKFSTKPLNSPDNPFGTPKRTNQWRCSNTVYNNNALQIIPEKRTVSFNTPKAMSKAAPIICNRSAGLAQKPITSEATKRSNQSCNILDLCESFMHKNSPESDSAESYFE